MLPEVHALGSHLQGSGPKITRCTSDHSILGLSKTIPKSDRRFQYPGASHCVAKTTLDRLSGDRKATACTNWATSDWRRAFEERVKVTSLRACQDTSQPFAIAPCSVSDRLDAGGLRFQHTCLWVLSPITDLAFTLDVGSRQVLCTCLLRYPQPLKPNT